MDFNAFEREARRVFDSIPARYRDGLDGLTVHRRALRHPRFDGVFTLGECVTESWPSSWESAETVRSVVLLYWGSFRALARSDPRFDWAGQIWETLTHELRHHLESLADTDELCGVDYAMEQTFRRVEGNDFEPHYYRRGDRIAPNVYAVEDDVYIEQRWTKGELGRAGRVRFGWAGRRYSVPVPVELGDVTFVGVVAGVEAPPYLELVLVRKTSWMDRLRAAFGGRPLGIHESEAEAEAEAEEELG